MKGVVFVLFEDFVTQGWGPDAFDELLDACPHAAKEPFVSPRTYPDTWLMDMLAAACAHLSVTQGEALRAFGHFAFPELVRRFPSFVEGVTHPKPFLLSVHDVIHVEVRKLMPEAITPHFSYADTGPDRLKMWYRSPRNIPDFMAGLLDGVAAHFGVPITVQVTQDGDAVCFDLRFAQPWSPA